MTQPLGEAAFWILTALASGRRHGYAVMAEVAELSNGVTQLKATTLYAVLERLRGDGLVEQDGDEVVEGRTRRYFRLTDAGARRLRVETETLDAKVRAARRGLGQFRRPIGGIA